jgi:hypothetical protein
MTENKTKAVVWCEANQAGGRSSSRAGSGLQLAETETQTKQGVRAE